MKSLLKSFYYHSSLFFETIISIMSVLLFSSFKVSKHYTVKKNHDSDCYILCGGPSTLLFLNLRPRPTKNIFAVNFFATSDLFNVIRPDHYIVVDDKLIGRPYPGMEEKVDNLYKIIKDVEWPITLYYPTDVDKKILNMFKDNPNITCKFFNKTPVSGYKTVAHFFYRHSLGMPLPQNVSCAAIFCAINSGYNRIYLYGVEHSWLKNFDVNPQTHRIYINDGHFYNNTNKRYVQSGSYCKVWVISIYKALLSHFKLRAYADSLGVKIVNRTPNSFIEAYEFE